MKTKRRLKPRVSKLKIDVTTFRHGNGKFVARACVASSHRASAFTLRSGSRSANEMYRCGVSREDHPSATKAVATALKVLGTNLSKGVRGTHRAVHRGR